MKLEYTPFVVIGASKSGTTWLQQLLNAHPKISCKFQRPILPLDRGEINLYHEGITVFSEKKSPFVGLFSEDEEEQYKTELSFLTETMKTIQNKLDSDNGLIQNSFEKYLRRFIDAILYERDASACGTKSYTDLEEFIRLFPEGKVISIVRDPRDVVVSKRFHTYRMGVYFLGDERYKLHRALNNSDIFRRFVKSRYHSFFPIVNEKCFNPLDRNGKLTVSKEAINKYANEWVLVNEYIYSFKENNLNNHLIIKYEDLRKNTLGIISKVFDFLGEPTDQRIVSDLINDLQSKKKTMGKNGFFRKGISGDYLNHLSVKQIELINEICKETAEKLEYELEYAE